MPPHLRVTSAAWGGDCGTPAPRSGRPREGGLLTVDGHSLVSGL